MTSPDDVRGQLTDASRTALSCNVDDELGRHIREILDRVGDKWSVLVIGALRAGPLRFGELRRSVGGVSQRMLTLTVRQLERDGLVTRTVHPQIPPRVDYELTELGRTLIPLVTALAMWAVDNYADIDANRVAFDRADRTSDGLRSIGRPRDS